jgi:hypothetical protein
VLGAPGKDESADLPFGAGGAENIAELLGQFGAFVSADFLENFFMIPALEHASSSFVTVLATAVYACANRLILHKNLVYNPNQPLSTIRTLTRED